MRDDGIAVGDVSSNHSVNNFDAIRAIAAFGVLISHAFPLSYGDDADEPLFRLTNGETTIGTIAVAVFFTISGYLITRSFLSGGRTYQGVMRFVRARALRIMPALVVTLLLLATVVGPLLTVEHWTDYFSDPQILKFVFVNLSFLSFHDGLPGVFNHNPYPGSVDGSLWTLRHEVRCYAVVLILGLVGLLRKNTLAAVTLLCLFWAFESRNDVAFLFACFLAGATLFTLSPPIDGRIAGACACLTAASIWLGLFRIVGPVFGSYVVLWLALSRSVRLPRLAKYGDFSYGIYIFAFPVQQIVAQTLADRATWVLNVLISTPITVALAVASWRLIERPALALKDRSSRGSPKIVTSLASTRQP